MVRLIGVAAVILAACVDKASEDDRPCPCGDGRTCCFDVCMRDGEECAVEETIGLGGGTLTAPNGATLEIPFGALEEDTVIRMRSVEPEPVAGVTFLGGAVALEPEGLTMGESALLTLPFDVEQIPSGAEAIDVRIHVTPAGRPFYKPTGSEVTATTMEVAVSRLMSYVPAHSQTDCAGSRGSANTEMCSTFAEVGGVVYSVECPQSADFGIVTCRCLEDGVETRKVDGTCEFDLEVYRYACGFPCPDEAPPVMPDAGPTDASPPI